MLQKHEYLEKTDKKSRLKTNRDFIINWLMEINPSTQYGTHLLYRYAYRYAHRNSHAAPESG